MTNNMTDNIMVSIICTAYNHEEYIEDALESFIKQKTKFSYEVLINDDASTDNTAVIIKKYEERYPEIIRPFYQKENQYSQNISNSRFLLSNAKGKYFAFCEGDDYWIDEYKLQKQVDYMEDHPTCSLCVHNAVKISPDKNYIEDFCTVERDRIIPIEEVILRMGGFCATNSIMGRIADVRPLPFFFDTISMDYTWQIYLASCGYAYGFEAQMSAYRVETPNSWTRTMASNVSAHVRVLQKMVLMLSQFDSYTHQKYHSEINEVIISTTYEIAIETGDPTLLKSSEMGKWLRSKPKKKIVMILLLIAPRSVYKVRNTIKHLVSAKKIH